ncbi:MAG: protein-disulfide reductase DsbD family protein [Nitrospinota bacterium]
MKNFLLKASLLAVLINILALPLLVAIIKSDSVTTLEFVPDRDNYHTGSSYKTLFRINVDDGYHIQSFTKNDSFIETELKLNMPDGFSIGKFSTQEEKLVQTEFANQPLALLDGKVYVATNIAIDRSLTPGLYPFTAALTVQACSDIYCYSPSIIEKEFTIKITDTTVKPTLLNEEDYSANESLFRSYADNDKIENSITDYLTDRGLVMTLFLVFIAGMALNLTPCVYPIIPITFSYFSKRTNNSKFDLLPTALFYVLGMALMYSSLGIFAVLTGELIGSILQNRYLLIAIAIFLCLLALSMFDLYKIQLPRFLQEIAGKNRKGWVGAFLMGLTVGIIAAPCIGPFVLTLITYVSSTQDLLFGFTLFFIFGLGLGMPYLLLAFFAGSLSNLPSPGVWMIWINRLFGFVILALALFMIEPLIGGTLYIYFSALLLIVAAIYLGFGFKYKENLSFKVGFRITRVIAFIALVGIASWLIINLDRKSDLPNINWVITDDDFALTKLDASFPTIIDFYASWCIPCKELDEYTFSDHDVTRLAKQFNMIKIDLTFDDNLVNTNLRKKFDIKGVPTILFLDQSQNVIESLTVSGFVSADIFVEKMNQLLKESNRLK